jgi:hypothetical protein
LGVIRSGPTVDEGAEKFRANDGPTPDLTYLQLAPFYRVVQSCSTHAQQFTCFRNTIGQFHESLASLEITPAKRQRLALNQFERNWLKLEDGSIELTRSIEIMGCRLRQCAFLAEAFLS